MKKNYSSFKNLFIALFLFCSPILLAQGKVYLVLGSDTAIWDGLDVGKYHDTYNLSLYTDPQRNAYKVMDPAFRSDITDSYGGTLKMTWWMMAGNVFRYATNTDVPLPNTMTLYLMKKYHGDAVKKWGDELSLHYHTFFWYDYNNDGKYYWNQAQSFSDCREDFDVTLAQFLLDEDVYPVTFRSGWHYMDNGWQNYLNQIIPFSMHDDYPNVHKDTVEPIDNDYDWSKSSGEFVPFHPSSQNYQLAGDGKGWNDRSLYMASMDTSLMAHVFSQAQKGIDQVVCLWAHLPEDNFLDNIKRINQIAHQVAAEYPDVKFRYCTADEAMRLWMKSSDTTAPSLSLTYVQSGGKVSFVVKTNETIFQAEPFVAVKDRDANYSIVHCRATGQNEWTSDDTYALSDLAKAGAAVTDTVGNLSTAFINFLPDDIYIDNLDSGYKESYGNWTTSTNTSWGIDSRQAALAPNDSAEAVWSSPVTQNGNYNVFIQVPSAANPADKIDMKITQGDTVITSRNFSEPLPASQWVYVATPYLHAGSNVSISMTGYGSGQNTKLLPADVVKISALVRDRRIFVPQSPIDFGLVSQDDSASYTLTIDNRGINDLRVSGFSDKGGIITSASVFPIAVPPMGSTTISLMLHASNLGALIDTLFIFSDDSTQPSCPVIYSASVLSYFKLIDNSDSLHYSETGVWNFSSAEAYGLSSRFAYLHQSPPASASFTAKVNRSGVYDIEEIVPATVNASKNAIYVLSIQSVPVDTFYVDQNQGSGDWVVMGRSYLPAGVDVQLKVVDSGENTPNAVLRADAVRFSLVEEVTGVDGNQKDNMPFSFRLNQNYPNPFNPSTVISYRLPREGYVTLKIYDALGREVKELVNREQSRGVYSVNFDASQFASGIYFYQLRAGGLTATKKMLLVK